MERPLLSKSAFMRAVQCPKSLYLYKKHYDLKDKPSKEQQAIFDRGNNVGMIARNAFPGGFDAFPGNHMEYEQWLNNTQNAIKRGEKIIYEAAFCYNRIISAIDILVRHKDKWYAYEVKSSAKVTNAYITDASIQYYVMRNSGIELEDFKIVHLNTAYELKGRLEPSKLFTGVSVIEDLKKALGLIEEKIREAMNVLAENKIPEVSIGTQCFDPYPCDFKGYCWKNVPKNSVFELTGLHKEQQFNFYHSGIETIDQIPKDSSLQKVHNLHINNLDSPIVNTQALRKYLDNLQYPLYFADFETFMPAIPLFEGNHPFQQMPFLYSLHYKKDISSEPEHKDFLGGIDKDPSEDFLKSFLNDTKGEGDIMVYNLSSEKSILLKLGKQFPQYNQEVNERASRMKDLIIPFKDLLYYHPLMKGSYSIKAVLPALVPELSYTLLQINNGNVASAEFEKLIYETDIFKLAEKKDFLREYCKMDTLAMVKILEVLEEAAKSG
jgi:predicted RecB family nuclease